MLTRNNILHRNRLYMLKALSVFCLYHIMYFSTVIALPGAQYSYQFFILLLAVTISYCSVLLVKARQNDGVDCSLLSLFLFSLYPYIANIIIVFLFALDFPQTYIKDGDVFSGAITAITWYFVLYIIPSYILFGLIIISRNIYLKIMNT